MVTWLPGGQRFAILVIYCTTDHAVYYRYDLAKAELASSYDSHHHRSKEKFPHRVNGTVSLCHKIFRPDPEEVKRRLKLKKKKMMEEEGLDGDDEASKEEVRC